MNSSIKSLGITLLALAMLTTVSCSHLDWEKGYEKNQKPLSTKETIRAQNKRFQKCIKDQTVQGVLVFSWKIVGDGSVQDLIIKKDSINNNKVSSCFYRNLKRLKFSTFGLGYLAKIHSYTFVFKKKK